MVLIGVSGSGKSTFARRQFRPWQVLSSDFCRGLVADDEDDQSASTDAFDVLHYIAGKRLAGGRLTVVDATNVQPVARKALISLARAHDVLPVAIVLDMPLSVCAQRNEARADRDFGVQVLRRQRDDLRRSLSSLQKEGFRYVHVLHGQEDVDGADVVLERLFNDLRHLPGPFDVIGDVHGCRAELELLLERLGYRLDRDDSGRPVSATHPAGRTAVFVGDLVDRGPDTPGVLRLVMGMVGSGTGLAVTGNHDHKLLRALRGARVQVTHGLAASLDQMAGEPADFRDGVVRFLDGLVSHYSLDGGRLVVAHAGLPERYHLRTSRRVRAFAMFGDTTGETDEYGLPVRLPWANDYRGRALVAYGHTPLPELEWVNNTLCLDTGCVFGGSLTALRYPEREAVSVPAQKIYYEPVRPLAPAPAPGTEVPTAPHAGRHDPEVLDITDLPGVVRGHDAVELGAGARVTVRPENAAAALEVLTRFSLDPRWLVYLPPTMAPGATSALPGMLEHPDEAFAEYRAAGVQRVVCEEKHMGSRAVAVVCRDHRVAHARFGAPDGATGAVYTRTGRPFFPHALAEELIARLRRAIGAAGLWEELRTGWLCLDAEILPWSAKAADLLRGQYAATGAAARAALPAAVDALDGAARRGVDVAALLERTRTRRANADAFTAAYRRYCWETDGLGGIRIAPFQLLAGEGTAFARHEHTWHLAHMHALAAADPDLILRTRECQVDLHDPGSVTTAVEWWDALTAAGGEGMVVKPLLVNEGSGGRVQPGIKVRGREYLRIIYGPDYAEPANLSRLRSRMLGRKRSLALREHRLGMEALDRAARGEPLHRVHECVFAVLALESEPVDPRL